MVQNALMLETTDCNFYRRDIHVRLVGGEMDGWQMHREIAEKKYGLTLNVSTTHIALITDGELHIEEL